MDAVRDRLLEVFDSSGRDAYRLAVMITGDSGRAHVAVIGAFSALADEIGGEVWAVSGRARLLHHVLRRTQPPRAGDPPVPPHNAEELIATARALPTQQRRAVLLHCGLGLDGPELASALDLPTSVAASQLRRGVAAVSARMEGHG